MTPLPAAVELRAFLDRASMRLVWIYAAEGAAIGLGAAFALALLELPPRSATALGVGLALCTATIGAFIRIVRANVSGRDIAKRLEARAPHCRNIVVTAEELTRTAARRTVGTNRRALSLDSNAEAASEALLEAPTYVADVVIADAVRIVRTLDLATLFPARNAILALSITALLIGLTAARDTRPMRTASRAVRRTVPAATVAIENVEITVTAPLYAAQAPRTIRDVARVDALMGSRIRLRVRASADSLVVQTLRGTRTIASSSAELFTVDIPADQDGFVTLIPRAQRGREGAHRLIGISVRSDQLPHVRIAAPGRDLFLKDARRTIELGIEADDDLGLASLRLRYTKVSGSGERFTFTEGEVPLNITRTSPRAWKASGAFRLDALGLGPGDMVVYRAITTDRRPGAQAQESDSFIAEITAPGSDAASGFSIDADQERYAISQQMVILKTQRLIARRATMPPDSANAVAQEIAAEQRKVRAEFVFMMGGEMADAPDPSGSMMDLNEEAEAEGEADIAAGRLANQGRMALTRATRYMSRAATTLTTMDLATALTSEKAALAQLEQAFSRTRILLRALSERERLDMTRRLSGTLTDARSNRRGTSTPPLDARNAALFRVLTDIATVVRETGNGRIADGTSAARLAVLAEAVLRVDPSSKVLQKVASRLSEAATLLAKAQRDRAQQQLDSATVALATVVRSNVPSVPPMVSSFSRRQLGGALGDALRAASAPSLANPKPAIGSIPNQPMR